MKKRARVATTAVLLGLIGAALGIRLALTYVPGTGPALADALRAVVGARAVTRLEELTAAVEDRLKRTLYRRKPPSSLEQFMPPPTAIPSSSPSAATAPGSDAPAAPKKPDDVGPMQAGVAARGDGQWKPVPDPARPQAPPLLFATLLHPDPKRPWAEVFVVATSAANVRLYAVAGTVEPQATTLEGTAYARRGKVPESHVADLLAAFNGGFKTEHGHHGMFVDGVTLVPPRAMLCTVVGYEDGRLEIGSWKAIGSAVSAAQREGGVRFWRQGAPCMYERGALNPLLRNEEVRNWGATIEGNVVIRRSAIGVSADRELLFVAVSNDTTARAMALAVGHAGASDVTQLDVNWSYPRFVLFPRDAQGRRRAQTLFQGFLFRESDYVELSSPRDFFYIRRRDHLRAPE